MPIAEGSTAARLAAMGLAYPTTRDVLATMLADNGASLDFWRNNVEGIALASAARTAQTTSADLLNTNARGIAAFLNVTAASGTGGLQLRVQYKDPASGGYGSMNSLPTAVIATGIGLYAVMAGISGGVPQSTSAVLPRTWRILVQVGDASSYTYSVGYSLLV